MAKGKQDKQVELNRRAAAAAAHSTRGRGRVFRDRSKYNRKQAKAVNE